MTNFDGINSSSFLFHSHEFGGIYRTSNIPPKMLTKAMVCFWKLCGQRIRKKYKVDKFPSTAKDIIENWMKGRIAIFIPHEVKLTDIFLIFPNLIAKQVDKSLIIDSDNSFGWLWIERSILSPNRDINPREIEDMFFRQGKQGQSLKTYVIGGIMMKYFQGQYFDVGITGAGILRESTSSILLGSCIEGRYLRAEFREIGGHLHINSPIVPYQYYNVGYRSEEKIKLKK